MRRTKLALAPVALFAALWTHLAAAQTTSDDACIDASDKAGALRHESKLLDARAALGVCSRAACPEVVRTSCEERLTQLNAAIPTIVFDVKDGAGRDLGGVMLTIDGVVYAERLGGAAIALDPIDHEFKFEVQGQAPVVRHFVLHESEQARHELITIGNVPPAAPPQPPVAEIAPPPPPAEPAPRSSWTTVRIAGWSTIGASGVAFGVGSVLGLVAIGKQHDAQKPENCFAATICTQHGADLVDQAKSNALGSTIAFVVGGAALAGGVALLVFAPSRSSPSPSARLSLGAPLSPLGLSLGGAF